MHASETRASLWFDVYSHLSYLYITNYLSDYCVYKSQYYHQGEEWFDGCSYKCRCEDAKNKYYQCTERSAIQVFYVFLCSKALDNNYQQTIMILMIFKMWPVL